MSRPQVADGAAEVTVKGGAGSRSLSGMPARVCLCVAFAWIAFQIAMALDGVVWLRGAVGPEATFALTWQRTGVVHLLFALVLSALAFPLFAGSRSGGVPVYDWLLAFLGACFAAYLAVLAGTGVASLSRLDLIVLACGTGLFGLAVYRAAGLPLLALTALMTFYVLFGDRPFMPDGLRWPGVSTGEALRRLWTGSDGVLGRPLEVSATLVFPLVVLGALMERAGGAAYIAKAAMSLVGHFRGGAVHAAAVSSVMNALTSPGSTQAALRACRVTAPVMMRTGVPAGRAAATEVSASANGQLIPPLMGAAVFVMADAIGLDWSTVAGHALLPAAIAYAALFAMIRCDAAAPGLAVLARAPSKYAAPVRFLRSAAGWILVAGGAVAAVRGLDWLNGHLPGGQANAMWIAWLAAYLVLVTFAARRPDFEHDDPDGPMAELPPFGATAMTGLYHLMPLALFAWWLGVGGEPARAAAHAAVAMLLVAATHHPLKALIRGQYDYVGEGLRRSAGECAGGLVAAGRLMVPVAVASAAAGLILGAASLSGAGGVLGAAAEWISGGRLWLLLILLALLSMILGLGLPSAAAYIVVASIVVPLMTGLGADMGLVAPAVAVHLFAFWFAVLGNDLPLLGQSANAVAASARGDPIAIGVGAWRLDLRIAVLPFFFLLVPELLLIGVEHVRAASVIVAAVFAAIALGAVLTRYFVIASRWWETAALAVVAVSLLAPNLWLDRIEPSYERVPPARLFSTAGTLPEGARLTFVVTGQARDGETGSTTLVVPLGAAGEGVRRIERAGLTVNLDGPLAILERPFPGTAFAYLNERFDFDAARRVEISEIRRATGERWPRETVYLPALALMLCIALLQRRRRARSDIALSPDVESRS
ncbi:MAG: TRAP transporter fused permease subunit [Hyphomicrobiales bacterium]